MMKHRRSTQIWNAGIELGEAWHRFADQELRNSFEGMPGAIDTINSQISDLAELAPAAMIGRFAEAVSSGLQQRQRREAMIAEMQSDLLDQLYNDQLFATGYHVALKPGRDPVQIDPDFFDDPEIDWAKSILRCRGQEYHDVRITDPATIPPLKGERLKNEGSRTAIIAAIDRVAAQNPEFCEMGRTEAAQLVRRDLAVEYSPGNGLSDQNIIKLIVAKCGQKRITE